MHSTYHEYGMYMIYTEYELRVLSQLQELDRRETGGHHNTLPLP